MAHKAMRGGEIGANGEFYKGGQFVADNPETAKGSRITCNTTHRIEIEPYKWIEASREERSIMRAIVGTVARWAGRRGGAVELVDNAEHICKHFGWNLEKAKEMVNRYNAGERVYTGSGMY